MTPGAPPLEQFRLELRVTIRKVEVDAAGFEKWREDRLEVVDTKNLGAMDFAGVARVLSRFYDVAQELTTEFAE